MTSAKWLRTIGRLKRTCGSPATSGLRRSRRILPPHHPSKTRGERNSLWVECSLDFGETPNADDVVPSSAHGQGLDNVSTVAGRRQRNDTDARSMSPNPINCRSIFPTLGPGYEGARQKVSLFGCSKSAGFAQAVCHTLNSAGSAAFQTDTASFWRPPMIRRPSGENAKHITAALDPSSMETSSRPVSMSQILIDRSLLAVATRRPSGEQAMAWTTSVWPISGANSWYVSAFQTLT